MIADKIRHVFINDPDDPRLARNISDDIADELKMISEKHGLEVFVCAYVTKDNKSRFIRKGHPETIINLLKGTIDVEIIDSPNGT